MLPRRRHDLRLCLAGVAIGARGGVRRLQLGFSLRETLAVFGLVDLGEPLSRLYRLVLVHRDLLHVAADLRKHRDDVAVHLGVIGALVPARVRPFLESPDEDDRGDDADDDERDGAAVHGSSSR